MNVCRRIMSFSGAKANVIYAYSKYHRSILQIGYIQQKSWPSYAKPHKQKHLLLSKLIVEQEIIYYYCNRFKLVYMTNDLVVWFMQCVCSGTTVNNNGVVITNAKTCLLCVHFGLFRFCAITHHSPSKSTFNPSLHFKVAQINVLQLRPLAYSLI